jgi:hypothetical protein
LQREISIPLASLLFFAKSFCLHLSKEIFGLEIPVGGWRKENEVQL